MSCGGGQRSRSRLCDSPAPQNNGRPCIGFGTQTDYCNSEACPSKLNIGVDTDNANSVLGILVTVGDNGVDLQKLIQEMEERLRKIRAERDDRDKFQSKADDVTQKPASAEDDGQPQQNDTASVDLQQSSGNLTLGVRVRTADIQSDEMETGRGVSLII